jgi:broad specificity phosphatase PhoE
VGQVLLVRHGQASFGADDYDVLSDLGWTQSRALGAWLASGGFAPALVLSGAMRRHRETAEALLDGGGWDAPTEVDAGWDEFDHLGVVARFPDLPGAVPTEDRRAFQRIFELATGRWTAGEHDADYPESFSSFVARVDEALARACGREGPVVVISSGGPIAAACAALVTADGDGSGAGAVGGAVRATLWRHFNTVQVNAGVTRVLVGRTGRRLMTFNEHSHLTDETLSYR